MGSQVELVFEINNEKNRRRRQDAASRMSKLMSLRWLLSERDTNGQVVAGLERSSLRSLVPGDNVRAGDGRV